MKTCFKTIFIFLFSASLIVSCVDEDDAALPPFEIVVYTEQFEDGNDNEILATEGWTNFAEEGSALWKTQEFDDNVYAEFSAFQTAEASNIAWLVSPAVTIARDDLFLKFAVSQSFVSSPANKLQVYISTDFAGDVETATWTEVDANIPDSDAEYFEFMDSGAINLSIYNGQEIFIAFKYTGSGTNNTLDGSYQIDDVTVYHN